MDRKTSLLELTKEVTEKHANFSVSEVNDHCMRIAVLEGEYVWHFHPGSDELFIVLEGELLIDFQDRPTEVLKANDSLLIPKGVIHRTRADVRSVNLCIEKTNAETVPFAEGNVLKLIRCKPAGQQLHAFSEAQAKWAPLQNVSGFIRQWGGWMETENGPGALVLVLWKSKRDYLNFMADHHDAIYERTNQKGTFESINITLFEEPAEISKTLQNNTPAPVPEWTVKGSG
ncbi:hypothetical protein CHCC20488_0308 [Bacillus paralicheniformis]|nr:DUF4937 domain-containing protein [Bacillus paralicheniformis]MDE1361635.1 DUF4937 domain-containing protein [Bacillus paralicheniformis]MEC2097369.1 DUF4937 domain-containing protein [Bacillus paralicheniformis]MEC2117864.1 DUF4937 domain-containing protein [Bacillus paralicheniformis]MEC2319651.1 DUF4937 domain-containing protein [Bacillus paralicheniformis]MED1191261.1 DUF4937 domain-containing protein [Bacillus paralicheniformis]